MSQLSGSRAFEDDDVPPAVSAPPRRTVLGEDIHAIESDGSARSAANAREGRPFAPAPAEVPPVVFRDPVVGFTQATDGGVRVEDFIAQVDANCVVGADTLFRGSVEVGGNKSIIVRGQVTGDVVCEGFVLVLPGAWIHGSVKASYLWVEGKIGPDNPAANTRVDVGLLHLGIGGRIEADVVYDLMTQSKGSMGIAGRVSDRGYAEAQS